MSHLDRCKGQTTWQFLDGATPNPRGLPRTPKNPISPVQQAADEMLLLPLLLNRPRHHGCNQSGAPRQIPKWKSTRRDKHTKKSDWMRSRKGSVGDNSYFIIHLAISARDILVQHFFFCFRHISTVIAEAITKFGYYAYRRHQPQLLRPSTSPTNISTVNY